MLMFYRSKDGTAELNGKLSYENGKGAYDVNVSKNMYKNGDVSIDTYAGIKKEAGGKREGQAGINMEIKIPN